MLRRGGGVIARLCFSRNALSNPELAACGISTERSFPLALFPSSDRGPDPSRSFTSSKFIVNTAQIRSFSSDGAAGHNNEDEFESTGIASGVVEVGDVPGFSGRSLDVLAESTAAGGLLSADAISCAAAAAEQAGLAAALGDAWIINRTFQYLIQYAHSLTGTPWWQSIVIATVVSRIAVFPLVVKQVKNTSNLTRARPELMQLTEWFKEQQAAGRGAQAQVEYTQRMSKLWEKYDCNPLKSMAPLLAQMPIFIGFFGALRSMAAAQVPSMTVGGIPFASYLDLTVADPYYSLPILSSLIFLVSVELNAADGMQGQDEKTLRNMKMFLRLLAVAMVPITGSMPQSVFCYWITSNIFSLGQSFVLRMTAVRKALGLPSLAAIKGSGPGSGTATLAAATVGKPIKTFAAPPKKRDTALSKNSKQ